MKKLFLVTRQDLCAGQQAVQACHAQKEFSVRHPIEDRQWYEESNTLALLAVPDEEALAQLLDRAHQAGIAAAEFREPDRGNELTAIALSPRAKKLCQRIPLALRNH